MRNLILPVIALMGAVAGGVWLSGTRLVTGETMKNDDMAKIPEAKPGEEVLVLGAGCFWCVEAVLKQVDGVSHVTSGYMGGKTVNPTYREVCTGETGHAEVVRVVYDPKKLPTADLLAWFWKLHDPTQLNRQGNDVGTQYRSVIFYANDAQKQAAEASKAAAARDFAAPIVTEISPAAVFYPGEAYHQDYYELNKNRNPYCPAVITPKLKKLGLDH